MAVSWRSLQTAVPGLYCDWLRFPDDGDGLGLRNVRVY
jgi:hypothetical protein